MKEFLNKLNGWQRAWIFLSLIILALEAIIAGVIIQFPQYRDVEHKPAFFEKMSESALSQIVVPANTGLRSAEDYAKWIVDNKSKKGTPEFDQIAELYQKARKAETSELLSVFVKMPNDYTIEVRKEYAGDISRELPSLNEYMKIIDSELLALRIKFILKFVLIWLGIIGSIYTIGWMFGWIYKGFKK